MSDALAALADKKIGFIGGGAMAEALAGGIVASGVPAQDVRIADPSEQRRNHLKNRLDVQVFTENEAVVREADLVVLAVKPGIVETALAELDGLDLSQPLWFSIAAGVTLERLSSPLPDAARIIRAMPNTPALVHAGATAFYGNPNCGDEDRALASALCKAVGIGWEAPSEELLDAVTGLSGSGPAYIFYFLMELIAAGEEAGLPRNAAERLSFQTVFGAAKMAMGSEMSPKQLKDQVTSPGGTTMAGLKILEDGRLRDAVHETVTAATQRSRELGRNQS